MKKVTHDKASRRYIITTALGITVLAFLILANLSGAEPLVNVPDSSSDISFFLNKSFEAVKIYEKTNEINPQNPMALCNKTLALYKLNKNDKKIKSYGKKIESNSNPGALHYNSDISKQALLHHVKFD